MVKFIHTMSSVIGDMLILVEINSEYEKYLFEKIEE